MIAPAMVPVLIRSLAVFLCCSTLLADSSESERIRRSHGQNANTFFENAMRKQNLIPLHGAFTRLWLNRELPEANRLLQDAQQAIIAHENGDGKMTIEIASSEHVK
jgi:hypothetical protein